MVLIGLLLVVTGMLHNFWNHQALGRFSLINDMTKNVALTGSFLLVIAASQ